MPRDDGRFDAFDHADRVKEGRAFELLDRLRDGRSGEPSSHPSQHPPLHHYPKPHYPKPHYSPPRHQRRDGSMRDRFSIDQRAHRPAHRHDPDRRFR